MIPKIYIDTDIIFDLLLLRMPFYSYSFIVFQLADEGKLELYVSSLSFTNLYYVLRKKYKKEQTIKALKSLSNIVHILSVDKKIINDSLESGFYDFEDAVQYYSAKSSGIEIIITRNKKDYKTEDITVMTADEFLATL